MNSELRSRPCPLCQSDSYTLVARGSAGQVIQSSPHYGQAACARLGIDPAAPFALAECDRCRFVYASEVPSDEFLARLYSAAGALSGSIRIFARPHRTAFGFHAVSTLLARIAQQTKSDNRGVTDRSVRILDVGCAFGVGSLGLCRANYPYEVVGVELSPAIREYLSREGMQAVSSLEELAGAPPFDGVLLSDVLEHLPDPVDVLKQIRPLLHAHSVVWVSVPNFSSWRLRSEIERINAGSEVISKEINPWEHLSYFSPETLNALMATIGLERCSDERVSYPVQIDSFRGYLTALGRAARDFYRVYRGSYPNNYETVGLFSFPP